MWIFVVAAAAADDLVVWEVDTFPADVPLHRADGWAAGYPHDLWFGVQSGDWAASFSDDNVEEDDSWAWGYGSGWAADDWLVHPVEAERFVLEAGFGTTDDDCMGLVVAHDGEDSFYLAGWTEDALPPPFEERAPGPVVFLLRVDDGDATVLAEAGAPLGFHGFHDATITVDDGHITFAIDGDAPILADDPDPLPPGRIGFYAYDAGWGYEDGTWAAFDYLRVTLQDTDRDGVADDDDNCKNDANARQRDGDDDGVGDACDPDALDTAETGLDTDVEDTGAPEPIGTCGGCDAAGGASAVWAALGLIVLRRRR